MRKKQVHWVLPALVSACALSLGITSAAAAAPPAAPILTGTNPPSPAKTVHVFVQGNAPAGTTVNVYPTSDCSGPPYPAGSAASFASPGIEIQVPNDSTTTLSATAVDASSNVSACSAPITFVQDSRPPNTFIDRIRVHDRVRRIIARFHSNESGVRFQCRADVKLPFGRCARVPRSVRSGLGRHTFQVRAIDAAGNVDPTPASRVVVIRRHG
jgi:hypothetical protein